MTQLPQEHKKHLKIRPARKFLNLFKSLPTEFKVARKSDRVNFQWLWSQARKSYGEQQNDPNAEIGKHVIVAFIKPNDIRMSARQRNRKQTKESFRPDLQNWYATTERLIRSAKGETYDEKWGRFLPQQRFNVDQSPLPFCVDMKKTNHKFEEGVKEDQEKGSISQPGSGIDNRQYTLQICFRKSGSQPRLAVIFRGTGQRVTTDEKKSWHPDIDVYFQENAWADTKFSLEWTEKLLKTTTDDVDHFILFCDNLTAQTSDPFKEKISSDNGVAWYGLRNATDLWQPVDALREIIESLDQPKVYLLARL